MNAHPAKGNETPDLDRVTIHKLQMMRVVTDLRSAVRLCHKRRPNTNNLRSIRDALKAVSRSLKSCKNWSDVFSFACTQTSPVVCQRNPGNGVTGRE